MPPVASIIVKTIFKRSLKIQWNHNNVSIISENDFIW